MTGPSHAACNIGRDLHFRLDRYPDAALLYHCSEDLPLMINCCNCSAAGRAQRLEWVRRQLDPPATFSSILSQNVQLSTNDEAFARRVSLDSKALRARPEREVCNPQIHLLHLPQHLSHLEARKTDNDNAKQQKER